MDIINPELFTFSLGTKEQVLLNGQVLVEGPFLIPLEVGKRYDYEELTAIVLGNEAILQRWRQSGVSKFGDDFLKR